ncbi:hypothetical protein GCM10009767_04760 [Kocuria aegyptia]|uniref:Uncharacterized protein n=1 Tax=Kocuria aegyptia TaxID=330943 RepID=A0ABN2K5U7_9MICC
MTWVSQSAISWSVAKRAVNSRKALSIVEVVGGGLPGDRRAGTPAGAGPGQSNRAGLSGF